MPGVVDEEHGLAFLALHLPNAAPGKVVGCLVDPVNNQAGDGDDHNQQANADPHPSGEGEDGEGFFGPAPLKEPGCVQVKHHEPQEEQGGDGDIHRREPPHIS